MVVISHPYIVYAPRSIKNKNKHRSPQISILFETLNTWIFGYPKLY